MVARGVVAPHLSWLGFLRVSLLVRLGWGWGWLLALRGRFPALSSCGCCWRFGLGPGACGVVLVGFPSFPGWSLAFPGWVLAIFG